jgi:hypothetical protein
MYNIIKDIQNKIRSQKQLKEQEKSNLKIIHILNKELVEHMNYQMNQVF